MTDFVKQMEMVLYHSDDGDISVDAYIKDESIWITQKAMAELFGVQVPAISKHLKKIFEEGELDEKVVISKMEITSLHGAMPGKTQTGEAMFYNLDAIISVGYRVNTKKATQFKVNNYVVLTLDETPTKKEYYHYMIDDILYECVPVYDLNEKCVAIVADGNFIGKKIDFV